MALVDQIDKLVDQWWLGTGTQACPMDWDRISTIKLTQRANLHGNRHFNECKRGTAKRESNYYQQHW
jgi:hypothetical protein